MQKRSAEVIGESVPGRDAMPAADWRAYLDATELTHRLIDAGPNRSPHRKAAEERARYRMDRLRTLLVALGNPQESVPLVHIAGTSGKGSTATAIAAGLSCAGYRTGLHTSPYLQSATENLHLDGRLISGREFGRIVTSVHEVSRSTPVFSAHPVSYGELWMAMTLYWFAVAGADVAVVETGAGGRFDLSNVIHPVLSVITTIGLDHTETLGPTLEDIAWHKAGIIKPQVPVVTGVREHEALAVIVREAKRAGSRLVMPDWHDQHRIGADVPEPITPNANLALAAASLKELNRLGLGIPDGAIDAGLAGARLPGRFEIVAQSPRVILDGALNPQKTASLASILTQRQLPAGGGRRTVIFGSLEAKSHGEMLGSLMPVTDRFVLTRLDVYGQSGANPQALKDELASAGFGGPVIIVPQPNEALAAALQNAEPGDEIIVTGSMYLLGNVRERWYPTRSIVEQQTPWPISD